MEFLKKTAYLIPIAGALILALVIEKFNVAKDFFLKVTSEAVVLDETLYNAVKHEAELADVVWFLFGFLVLAAIFLLIYAIFSFYNKHKNGSVIERTYKLRVFLNIASLSIVVIFILSYLASAFVSLIAGNAPNATDFYTAFIALCTTFVVGFQIYNSIDLNKKIEKLDADKKELEEQLKNINRITKRCEYFNAYTVGAIRYNDSGAKALSDEGDPKKYCWNAMKAYFNALRLAAEGGQDFRRALDALDGKIRNCIEMLRNHAANESVGTDENKYIYNNIKVNTFITTISGYIEKTISSLGNFEHIDEETTENYKLLVSVWKTFVLEVIK